MAPAVLPVRTPTAPSPGGGAPMPRYLCAAPPAPPPGGGPPAQMPDDRMQPWVAQTTALKAERTAADARVLGARLPGGDTATVVRMSGCEVLTTDGPFI